MLNLILFKILIILIWLLIVPRRMFLMETRLETCRLDLFFSYYFYLWTDRDIILLAAQNIIDTGHGDVGRRHRTCSYFSNRCFRTVDDTSIRVLCTIYLIYKMPKV